MRKALVLVVLFCAAAAVAQSNAPQPTPPERARAPRESSLNLKLDDADMRALPRSTSEPRDQAGEPGAGGLPSLGANARPLERNTRPAERMPAKTPFPPDTERSQ